MHGSNRTSSVNSVGEFTDDESAAKAAREAGISSKGISNLVYKGAPFTLLKSHGGSVPASKVSRPNISFSEVEYLYPHLFI